MTDGWSEHAWRSVKEWYDAILEHPFLVELSDGSLPEQVFARYLIDDSHYLIGYARALSSLATRTADPAAAAMLAGSAAQGIAVERELHASYLTPRGIDPRSADAPEQSPTCSAYIGSLQTLAAFAPVEVGLAGVLPCFRVYAEVGSAVIAKAPDPDHPYRAWVDAYADPSFDQAVRTVEAHADAVAEAATPQRRAEMLEAYVRATRFEWMFWDAAWRGETWPTPQGSVAEIRR
ncbi:TenA family protein [Solicola gregarius]|uniref:TenA family protein n=1 Tax=Solicola gregarius TaxID=2908642 RepID=A0AA46YKI5_9ACTN|nr:TenA family protein [Solicola gregarius]UYM05805.1 TenA family protein [Solicola gregarius]